jgi:hypothetical protein
MTISNLIIIVDILQNSAQVLNFVSFAGYPPSHTQNFAQMISFSPLLHTHAVLFKIQPKCSAPFSASSPYHQHSKFSLAAHHCFSATWANSQFPIASLLYFRKLCIASRLPSPWRWASVAHNRSNAPINTTSILLIKNVNYDFLEICGQVLAI